MPYSVLSGNAIVGSSGMDSNDLSQLHIYTKEDDDNNLKLSITCKASVTKQFEEFEEIDISDKCIYRHLDDDKHSIR